MLEEIRQRTEAAALHLGSLTESLPQIAVLPKLAHAFEIYMSYIAKANCPPATEELTLMKGRISLMSEVVSYCRRSAESIFFTETEHSRLHPEHSTGKAHCWPVQAYYPGPLLGFPRTICQENKELRLHREVL